MSDSPKPSDPSRRTALGLTVAAGTVGTAAVAVPLLVSMAPSERAKAAGAPVEVDLSQMKPGELRTVDWRGKPVWILRRTEEMLKTLDATSSRVADPNSDRPSYPTPEYAKNEWRSIKPEYLVVVAICTHLGCVPVPKFGEGDDPSLPANWPGGFLCPCHGSTFDYAARVFRNMPAPDNLEVPPHMYLTDTRLLIGEDDKQA